MARPFNFTQIAFTPAVKEEQKRYGSRAHYATLEERLITPDHLTEREIEFIRERDGFYQATVGENGWPYVQYRGGPQGFLKVLDEKTLGYADFQGNLQYISVGNMRADERVSLILMDYANRRRLKIWARAQVTDATEDPALIERLESPDYRARIERAVVLKVEAFDWNCPQHITRRYTEEELADLFDPFKARIAELEAEVAALKEEQGVTKRTLPRPFGCRCAISTCTPTRCMSTVLPAVTTANFFPFISTEKSF